MPPLPVTSGHWTVQALLRAGFVVAGQRGSHVKLRDAAGHTVIVPMHAELRAGTLRSVLRQAGLTVEQFTTLLK